MQLLISESTMDDILIRWLQILIAVFRTIIIKSTYSNQIWMSHHNEYVINWLKSVGIQLKLYTVDVCYIYNVVECNVLPILQKYIDHVSIHMCDPTYITDYIPDEQICRLIFNSLYCQFNTNQFSNIMSNPETKKLIIYYLNNNVLPSNISYSDEIFNILTQTTYLPIILGVQSTQIKSARNSCDQLC